jgi:hypothetical protein
VTLASLDQRIAPDRGILQRERSSRFVLELEQRGIDLRHDLAAARKRQASKCRQRLVAQQPSPEPPPAARHGDWPGKRQAVRQRPAACRRSVETQQPACRVIDCEHLAGRADAQRRQRQLVKGNPLDRLLDSRLANGNDDRGHWGRQAPRRPAATSRTGLAMLKTVVIVPPRPGTERRDGSGLQRR